MPLRLPLLSGVRGIDALGALAVLLMIGLAAPRRARPDAAPELALAQAQLEAWASALEACFVDTGRWPAEVGDGSTCDPAAVSLLFRDEAGTAGWAGPYLAADREGLRDPWGRAFGLRRFAAGAGEPQGALVLWSSGPNGTLESDPRGLRAARAGGDDLVRRVARLE